MKTRRFLLCAAGVIALLMSACQDGQETQSAAQRWSEEKANEWYANLPWMAGADYINADAINQIEMWSGDTYNHDQIDKELSWAEDLGFKTLRVYLSSVVYENDPEGLKHLQAGWHALLTRRGRQHQGVDKGLTCIASGIHHEKGVFHKP